MEVRAEITGRARKLEHDPALEARRIEGSDFFCGLTFPVGDGYCTLILGGWGGGVTGLSNIDDESAVDNETTGYTDFQRNRWYAVRLQVTDGHVRAWIGEEQIVDVERRDRKFSVWWEQEPVRPFGVSCWYTKAALRKVTVRGL